MEAWTNVGVPLIVALLTSTALWGVVSKVILKRMELTAKRGSSPKTKEQKRREAEARNRAYAALKHHRKRIAELDRQLERDNARMKELLELMADPDFYINEAESSDAIAEHGKLKARVAAAEEEWFLLNEELEEEMRKQQEQA